MYQSHLVTNSTGIVDLSKSGNSALAAGADNGISPLADIAVAAEASALPSSLSCENELERRETVWPTSFMPPPMALLVARRIVVEAAMTAVSACSANECVGMVQENSTA